MTPLPDVREGDVWKDTDRRGGPTIRITGICEGGIGGCPSSYRGSHAHVVTIPGDKRPRTVLLHRFRRDYELTVRHGWGPDR